MSVSLHLRLFELLTGFEHALFASWTNNAGISFFCDGEKNGVVLFEINEYPYIEIYSHFVGSHVVLRSFFMSFFKIIFMYVWVFMGHFFGFMLDMFGLLVSSYISGEILFKY